MNLGDNKLTNAVLLAVLTRCGACKAKCKLPGDYSDGVEGGEDSDEANASGGAGTEA